jgi:hypothetical protein
MPVQKRALIIGLAGPAVQAFGLAWEMLHILRYHLHEPLTTRHIAFETGFLLILVGFAITILCVPVALEVARARASEVAMPVLGADSSGEGISPQFGKGAS